MFEPNCNYQVKLPIHLDKKLFMIETLIGKGFLFNNTNPFDNTQDFKRNKNLDEIKKVLTKRNVILANVYDCIIELCLASYIRTNREPIVVPPTTVVEIQTLYLKGIRTVSLNELVKIVFG